MGGFGLVLVSWGIFRPGQRKEWIWYHLSQMDANPVSVRDGFGITFGRKRPLAAQADLWLYVGDWCVRRSIRERIRSCAWWISLTALNTRMNGRSAVADLCV